MSTKTTTLTGTPATEGANARPANYKKRLEGVILTDELLRLWKECRTNIITGRAQRKKPANDTGSNVATLSTMSKRQASQILRDRDPNRIVPQSSSSDPRYLPMDVICAMKVVLEGTKEELDAFEKALTGTKLFFTPPPPRKEETEEQRQFRLRMDRLRWKNEERKYSKLTSNLQKYVHDDVTARSMTYAASVGLNMVIAPLSFGCFMYFFAGSLFDYFLGESFAARTTGGVDIKRVIVGVISGVIMLFIEMILFVIRTHEFEEHNRKKQKKKGTSTQPFGVYSKKVSTGPIFQNTPKEKQQLSKKQA